MAKFLGFVGYIERAFLYFVGRSDTPPEGFRLPLGSALWGIWWGIMLLVALVFCGQSSKFIYIDF